MVTRQIEGMASGDCKGSGCLIISESVVMQVKTTLDASAKGIMGSLFIGGVQPAPPSLAKPIAYIPQS